MLVRSFLLVALALILVFFFKPPPVVYADGKETLFIEQGKTTLLDPVKLAPSRELEEKTVTVRNDNEVPVDIDIAFNFYLHNNDLNQDTLAEMLSMYEIKGKVSVNERIYSYSWTTLDDWNDFLKTLELTTINAKEAVEFTYVVRLNELASNDFQLATLHGELTIRSLTDKIEKVHTEIKDDTTNELPKTATNLWNLLYIGTLLIIAGLAILIYYSIRFAQWRRGAIYEK
ncbi:hypothetical protein [Bacillus sp. FJAT-45066]|uniref:hypothetical protein n=1 Tax=Bacillus sp. FJAT-45066 TaxID=2011010 RepID=UPI000BB8D4F3|nr:hypothetical protein [Bacillus sp. FJAT-45066]